MKDLDYEKMWHALKSFLISNKKDDSYNAKTVLNILYKMSNLESCAYEEIIKKDEF